MSANVFQLERVFRRTRDWSPQELAEFYRVESTLIQAGLKIETERGLSDEKDPWFAFCRADDGEVIVHIARVDGVYVLAGPAYDGIACGTDIAALVRDLVARHPLIQTRGNDPRQGSKIFLHPAALLMAVVATAFFKSTEARALTDDDKVSDNKVGDSRGGGAAPKLATVSMVDAHHTIAMDAAQSGVILSAIAAVLQAPSSDVAEHTITSSAVSTSDLLDFALPPPPSSHSISSAPIAALGFDIQQNLDAQPSSTPPIPAAPTHIAGVADALPLVAVLWNLSERGSVTKTIGQDAGGASTASTASDAAAMAFQAPLITFKMGPATEATENLPIVQGTKISSSSSQGAAETHTLPQPAETHTLPQPDQLPTVLTNALQQATHTTIDGQAAGLPSNTSFADALMLSRTNADASHTSVSQAVTHSGSTADPTHPVGQTATPADQLSPSNSVPNKVGATELQAVLDHLIGGSSPWSVVSAADGKQVVLYDPSIMTGNPAELKSASFDFADGSTLSLVGTPADLTHYFHVA